MAGPTGSGYTAAANGGSAQPEQAAFGYDDFFNAVWGDAASMNNLQVQQGRNIVQKPVIGPLPYPTEDARPIVNGKPLVGPLPTRPTQSVKQRDLGTMSAILQSLSMKDPATLTRLQAKLQQAGYIGPNTNVQWGLPDEATKNGFAELLMVTSRLTAAGTDKTWQEVLAESIDPSDEVKKAMGQTGAGTRTSKTIEHLSYQKAHAAFEQVFTESIGRRPSETETTRFQEEFNKEAAAHPDVSKTTIDSAGNTVTTQTPGLDAGQFALDKARENPDYANYQAVGTYFPLMQQLLGEVAPSNLV